MQSINAQEKPWKSSEEFDIKINSDSAQCTLQVPIPMPGTRKKRDRKEKPNSSAHSRPSFLSRFQVDPQILVVLSPPCLPTASGATILGQTPRESCPHGVKIQGDVREAFGLFKIPGECFSPRAQPWLSVLSIPWRKVEKPAGAAFPL